MSEILFLAHRFPYPPDRGDKIRSWHILKALNQIAPTHVAALVDDRRDLEHVNTVNMHAASLTTQMRDRSKLSAMAIALMTGQSASVAAFGNRALQSSIDKLLAEHPISTIFAFSGQMAQFVPEKLGNRRFVMDFVDVDSAKFETYGAQSGGAGAHANRMEAKRLSAFEIDVAKRANLSLFVSEAEAALFRSKSGLDQNRVRALENGIDLSFFDPAATVQPVPVQQRPLIVFTGQMDYRPNIEAVTKFAREAFLIVKAHLPNAQFAIVGRSPTDEVNALRAIDGVVVTGEVPDTRAWLAAADVVVAPLLLARGVQNKVLEALAMAKPVVASPPACEGIDASPKNGLFCMLNPRDEAEQIISLFNNPEKARSFGKAARARMIARYGWDAQLRGLSEMVMPKALDRAA